MPVNAPLDLKFYLLYCFLRLGQRVQIRLVRFLAVAVGLSVEEFAMYVNFLVGERDGVHRFAFRAFFFLLDDSVGLMDICEMATALGTAPDVFVDTFGHK